LVAPRAQDQQGYLYPELEQIIASVKAERSQDLVVLFIPSHDKKQKEIGNQDQWAIAALRLLAKLYGGATAVTTFAGIYRDEDDTILFDKPIMIQAYVRRKIYWTRGD
jgi:predicted metal-dependent phosphoesterase TrpH